MEQTQFWNLLAKKIAGEASQEELKTLENLIKVNPGWACQAEQVEHLWRKKNEAPDQQSELAFEQHLQRMKDSGIDFPDTDIHVSSNKNQTKRLILFSAAAIVLFLTVGVIWLRSDKGNLISQPQKKYSEVSAPFGSKTKLVLPDSTVVWLNAGSKLTYNERFGIANRNTTLTGEAFFDVKRGSIPFIIRTNAIQIKVLGTAFNVKAYPDETTTETSLIHGRIEVTLDKRPGETIILKPNEKLIVTNEIVEAKAEIEKKDPKVVIDELTRINDTTIVEMSWVHNEFIFQDETFKEIAQKMERWYGVTIEFKDGQISNERLSGTFTTETIQEALTALQYSTKFHYLVKGNLITITQ